MALLCELCDEPCPSPIALCQPCRHELPWLHHCCVCCALPLSQAGLYCGACLKQPPAFHQAIMPWRYAFPVDRLITAFKHQSRWPYGRLLAQLFAQELTRRYSQGLSKPDLLVPTPLSRARLRTRGFNQSQMLSQWLADALTLPVAYPLQRCRDTAAQQGLDANARRKNLRGAFRLEGSVAGLHVALIDDVLTTGATADAMAKVLLKAKARQVDIYCLARTPAPGER